jgi:hypothetical protein
MKSVLWPILIFLLTATGCKKENPTLNRYSVWTVDGRVFQSNNIEVAEGKARSALACRDFENRFNLDLTGISDCLRQEAGHSHTMIATVVSQGSMFTLTPAFTFSLRIQPIGCKPVRMTGEASYYMPPTWFHYYFDRSDSVLIEGTFNEP